jgi:serine/threonine-protein kinase
MEADRDARIDQLFEQVLDLPAGERAGWLAAECAGDEQLRREVELLVELSGREVDALIAPLRALAAEAVEAVEAADGGLAVGDQIGAYRILGQLGRGGMGVVHLAERADGSFEKRVAIKVLPGAASSPEAIRRFEQERRILGRLSHPHIAQLVDGGVDDRGLPYLVLEYVEGEPVDVWCDRRQASLDQRLRLVIEFATALQTAHRNLVVHRDIKPSNLMVTGEGNVQLLDFGIAKLLDPEGEDAALTRTDGRPMTPTWASPEQVAGAPITVASDIYQLGLLLYELTTGLRPQAARTGSLAELVELVCRHEPLPPSRAVLVDSADDPAARRAARRGTTPARLARRLRPDLDAIVARALAKDPERRYASATELAADLERFLDGRPVRARRATFGYRITRWVRRNAALAAAGTVASLLTVGYAVAVTIQSRALERQRHRAEVEAAKATEVERFVLGLFESSDPQVSLGREVTARELLARGIERVDAELAGQPEVQARLWSALGEIHGQLGSLDEGYALVERALGQQLRLHGEIHIEVAETFERLGDLERSRGRWTVAEDFFERSLAIRRALGDSDSSALARTLARLGVVASSLQADARAEALFRESLEIHRRNGNRGGVAFGLNNLGGLLADRGDYRGAETHYREALELNRAVYGDRHPRLALNFSNLAFALRRQGRLEEALAPLREALEIDRATYGDDHVVPARRRSILGFAHAQLGNLSAAEAHFAAALPVLARELPADSGLLADARVGLAMLRVRQGRHAEARTLLEAALEGLRASFGERHHRVGRALLWLGRSLAGQGHPAEAVAAWRQGLPLMRPGADDELIAQFEAELRAAGKANPER